MKGKKYVTVMAALMFIAAAASAFGASPAVKTDRVVYLINGALGDNAFYDSGEAGIKNIEKTYKLQTRTIECNFDAAKFQPALDAAVQYADVIFVISYGFEDQLMAIADKYPNKICVNIDTIVENPKHTITSVFFLAEQSSYLAGMTAALATTTTSLKGVNRDKVIGVIGGDTDPIVSAFVFGFQNGAKAVDKDIKVLTKSLGGAWDDSAKGKQAALQLYDQKADVIYQVAAAAGIGVLQAATERGLYAIGVDTNQNDLEPGHVIASAVKNVGTSIEEVFKTIKNGSYKAGVIINADLASGGIDLVFDAKQQVLPKSLVDKVKAARQQIIDGKLKVQIYNNENVWQQ